MLSNNLFQERTRADSFVIQASPFRVHNMPFAEQYKQSNLTYRQPSGLMGDSARAAQHFADTSPDKKVGQRSNSRVSYKEVSQTLYGSRKTFYDKI